ncbi:MAG: NUDIX domain-containing protein [Clostridia bacterium]|nr:NUDIX domain-containing protein [Clostridia bacterium]
MKYEKSCGAVIMRKNTDNNIEVLLVSMKNGGHFSFPKGHVEGDETELETAAREILEETKLEVEFLDGFRMTTGYSPAKDVFKDVIYFAATPVTDEIKKQDAEILDIGWFPAEKAVEKVTFENDKKILTEALQFFAGRIS